MNDEEIQESFREAIRETYEGKEPIQRTCLSQFGYIGGFQWFFEWMERMMQRGLPAVQKVKWCYEQVDHVSLKLWHDDLGRVRLRGIMVHGVEFLTCI